jgi:hypothetical protein
VPEAARRSTFDLFPPWLGSFMGRMQAGTVGEITRGPHVAVQRGSARAIERAAGVRVAIVEPAASAAVDLYDPALRQEFLAFVRRLHDELGVAFVPLEALPPFGESDFADLVHVGREGVPKLSHGLVKGLREALAAPRPR